RSDIQAFLEAYRSPLAGMFIADKEGVNRTPADIIFRASEEYHINPKYLLVKLQKEQSLVTTPAPTQKQLDWATGYGVCDACSLDDPAIQKFKGFGVQADNAAGIMRWYYDHRDAEPWIKKPLESYVIDGISVRPENLATAFLYTYTPHLEGNKNFWKLWHAWFDQVYPNGTLMKTINDPSVYLISEGKRRRIMSMTVLTTRFDPKNILTIPEAEFSQYEEGSPLRFPNFSILRASSTYYLLDFDSLRPFENETVFKQFGYHPDEVIDVSEADILGYTLGSPVTAVNQYPHGRLLELKENGSLYFLKDGAYHPIFDKKIAKVNFPSLTTEKGSVSDLAGFTQGDPIRFADGTILGITGFSEIYAIEHGKRRHIPSEDIFLGLGYSWHSVVWTNEMVGGLYDIGVPLSLRAQTTAPVLTTTVSTITEPAPLPSAVTIEEGKRLVIPDEQSASIGTAFETSVNTYLVAAYPSGDILSGKNIDVVRPMASFAKMQTAYELFRRGSIDEERIISYERKKHATPYQTFRAADGEMFRAKDLFNALLVSSLNVPARMLVQEFAENETNFIADMNGRAEEWGLSHTRFDDVTGENLNTYTTAREYLTIFRKALENKTIQAYAGKPSYAYDEVLDLDGRPNHHDDHSNDLIKKKKLPFRIVASKTAYLDEAGAGLAMLIERISDGKQFVVITMGNFDYANRFAEPERLARWTIEKF
ncbi:MAG: serine hydrolase, partial [Patescibacteria group bacterium]